MKQVALSKENLTSHCAPKAIGRYAVVGLRVRPEKGIVESTDGRILWRTFLPDPDEVVILGEPADWATPNDDVASDVTIPLQAVDVIKPQMKARVACRIDTNHKEARALIGPNQHEASEVTFHLDEGQFPESDRIMADRPSCGLRLCLGIDVLEKVVRAMKAQKAWSIDFTIQQPTKGNEIRRPLFFETFGKAPTTAPSVAPKIGEGIVSPMTKA